MKFSDLPRDTQVVSWVLLATKLAFLVLYHTVDRLNKYSRELGRDHYFKRDIEVKKKKKFFLIITVAQF